MGEEDDCLQNNLGLELSPFDTTSVFSMPSMLSLHSRVEDVASRHEEKEVYTLLLWNINYCYNTFGRGLYLISGMLQQVLAHKI